MMSRVQLVLVQLSVALTVVTGVVFAVMKYWMKSNDPLAVVNHPLQPQMLAAHVVVAPVAVFAFGWIFGNHIWPGFTRGGTRSRPSGVWLMALIAPMVLSAYLLQISTGEFARKVMTIAHWTSSGAFVIAYLGHMLFGNHSAAIEISGKAEEKEQE